MEGGEKEGERRKKERKKVGECEIYTVFIERKSVIDESEGERKRNILRERKSEGGREGAKKDFDGPICTYR
jgi:hypothetical protein